MTLKSFLIVMILSTLSAWTAWLLVLFNVDPFTAGFVGFLLFYISLWLALTGTLSLVGLLIRSRFKREELIFRHVSNSFRQATFLSFLLISLLYFQSQQLLTWWNVSLLVVALTFLEFFWISYSGSGRRL